MADDAQSILAEMDAEPSNSEEFLDEVLEGEPHEGDEPKEDEPKQEETETKAKDEKTDDEKPREPLTSEELEKRWKDQQGATFAERQRRRELEDKMARMEQSFQAIQQRIQQPQQPQEQQQQQIDPEQDPVGFLKQLQQQQQAQAQAQQQQMQQQAQMQERVAAVHRLGQNVSDYEQDFVTRNPDYYEAAEHLMNARAQQLQSFGVTDQQEILGQIKAEIAQLTGNAIQRGINPAQAAYDMAKQMGYQRKQPEAQQRLDMARAGQRASKTVSGGGRGAGGPMSLADIADLEGPEFDKACEKLFSAA